MCGLSKGLSKPGTSSSYFNTSLGDVVLWMCEQSPILYFSPTQQGALPTHRFCMAGPISTTMISW